MERIIMIIIWGSRHWLETGRKVIIFYTLKHFLKCRFNHNLVEILLIIPLIILFLVMITLYAGIIVHINP